MPCQYGYKGTGGFPVLRCFRMNPQVKQPDSDPVVEPSRMGSLDQWTLIAAVNDDQVLQKTLLASPAIDGRCQVITKRGFPSAGKAYNAGIAEARHEILVFAHQDIYMPWDWVTKIDSALAYLAMTDPEWGVIGLVGVGHRPDEEVKGHCYSTGLQRFVGKPFSTPAEVRSLDEIVLIIRRSSGLTFDEDLPGFHFYGTDICLQAERRKMKSYVACAFCIHNTNGIKRFPLNFWHGYLYMQQKWWHELPVRTSCTTLTKWCKPMVSTVASEFLHRVFRPPVVGSRCDDVGGLYQRLIHNT